MLACYVVVNLLFKDKLINMSNPNFVSQGNGSSQNNLILRLEISPLLFDTLCINCMISLCCHLACSKHQLFFSRALIYLSLSVSLYVLTVSSPSRCHLDCSKHQLSLFLSFTICPEFTEFSTHTHKHIYTHAHTLKRRRFLL